MSNRKDSLSVEGKHDLKAQKRNMSAPKGCRFGMEIKTCLECKLPDEIGCDEDKGRHWLRDEAIRVDYARGMSMRAVEAKWGISTTAIQIILRVWK